VPNNAIFGAHPIRNYRTNFLAAVNLNEISRKILINAREIRNTDKIIIIKWNTLLKINQNQTARINSVLTKLFDLKDIN
jgi:hypothetical protein